METPTCAWCGKALDRRIATARPVPVNTKIGPVVVCKQCWQFDDGDR